MRQQLQYHEMRRLLGMTDNEVIVTSIQDKKMIQFGTKDCTACVQNDIDNVKRLELSYCMECTVLPNYIPVEQIRHYIKEKYFGDNENSDR